MSPLEYWAILGTTIGFPLILIGAVALLVLRLWRTGYLVRGLVNIVFLPEKRHWFLALLVLQSGFFLVGGMVEALYYLGVLSNLAVDVLAPITFVGGGVWLLLLVLVGLRPGELTAEQRARVAMESKEMFGMAFIPLEPTLQTEDPSGGRSIP